MALDPEKIRFKGKLLVAAISKGGSIEDTEAEIFVDELFSEWKTTGNSIEQLPNWLSTRLEGVFPYEHEPPKWIEEEPAWPFFNGRPMTFISQTALTSASSLSPNTALYVFGARVPYGKGFKIEYRVVEQFPEL